MTDEKGCDDLYRRDSPPQGDFVFDETVADVFPDMIRRSVPGYPAIINMIQLLAGRYAQPGTRLIDLGCSLGASTLALAAGAAGRDCRITAVDNAPAMIEKAQLKATGRSASIDWVCGDIRDTVIDEASIVVLNFTLQFLPTVERLGLLRRVHDGLRPGGILILSEKIAGADAAGDALLVDMHHAFKQANGYSDLEISRKRSALENVLIPETVEAHRQRLQQAGFARADVWFQCFNFMSLVARA